jgi:uncharacterized coiled-coil protein SlyX
LDQHEDVREEVTKRRWTSMPLVNIEDWLAARGHRGSPATTGESPGAPPTSTPSDTRAFIAELEGEIARQARLVQDLQRALATELDRNAKLVAHIRGVPPTVQAGRAPGRVIRKQRRKGPHGVL